MPLPDPIPGLVLHYSYLWHDQHRRGLEEGVKDRPCVVLSVAQGEGAATVIVAPITHQPPLDAGEAVEIPGVTKRRLGLDEARSWVMLTEINRFRWPGHDLRPVPRAGAGAYSYGVLPPALFRLIADGVANRERFRRMKVTPR